MTVTIRNWETGATILTIAEASNCVGVQAAGIDLTKADFADQNVRFGDFAGATITGARFRRAKTFGANFAGAVGVAAADFTDQDTSDPGYSLSMIHNSAFNFNPQNNKGWRNYSVFTHLPTGYQYTVLYRRIQGRIVVARRQVLDGSGGLLATPGAWTLAESGSQAIANSNDGHHVATIVVDGLGTVIVTWSWLDTDMRIWWGDTPGDMNVDERKALPIVAGEDLLEANPVYPEWVVHPSLGDDVLLTYWGVGNPGPNYGTIVRRWHAATKLFTTLTPNGLLKCGFNAYLATRTFDSRNRLWLPFTYRDSPGWDNHDFGVVISDPADGPIGTVWRDRAGNVLTLPVHPTDALNGVRYTIPPTDGLQNSSGFCLTDDERPIWGSFKGDPAEFFIVNERADGSTIGRYVGTQGVDFTLVGGAPGSSSFPLCQPRLLWRNNALYVFFRSDAKYRGLWCYVIPAALLEGTASLQHLDPVQVCDYDAVAYAPNWDEPLYEATGAFHVFVSRSSATATDLGSKTPAYILAFELPEATMGTLSSYARTALVDHVRNKTAYTPAATHYCAAFVAGVEVTGNAYARAANTNNTTTWPNAASRAKSNGVAFTFPQATGAWGVVDEIRIYDASGGGNELGRHTLSSTLSPTASTGPLTIPVGDIDITAAAGGVANATVHSLLDLMFGAVAYTAKVTTYGSYWAGDPQGAGSQASAARTAITQATTWGAASAGLAVSVAAVALADEGTGTYWAEHDASTAGNLMFSKLLPGAPSGGIIPAGGLRTSVT